MKLLKLVLTFQAIITLIFGMIFFAQVIALNIAKVSELNIEITRESPINKTAPTQINLKKRYAAAAYILLFISIMELIIIGKLLT